MITKLFAVGILSILFFSIAPAFAIPPTKEAGFVCPHLGGKAGENGNSPKIAPIYGGYTIPGPDVFIPTHAGNWGWPSEEHGVPGDPEYTAIWLYSNAP
jgi:hypothetical protein